jgi:alkanesulfonate monooxygenase SsuD/methylene tetrahydromethanopterin reductase-like flavin-dependent oxidoreductase (luciferase family)
VDYGNPLRFGLSVTPTAASTEAIRDLVRRADRLGLDLVGVQDHPYQRRFLDTWMLMATLLADTERIYVFPDVANLPLRRPAMLAKQAASLDVLSGGRFELGLGAGGFWDATAAMGGPRRSGREALEALDEAVSIIRLFWGADGSIAFEGKHYRVKGLKPGPPPAHPIGLWLGALRPRSLELLGRRADGWVPSLTYAPPEVAAGMHARIDEAATEAGRDPATIRRVLNVGGTIGTGSNGGVLEGPVEHWVEQLAGLVELGFDTFVFWPADESPEQVERFAGEVAPTLTSAVAASRRAA